MAEKSFGVKNIKLDGDGGTPTIESPNDGNLNITAATATFSGNITASSGTITGNGSGLTHLDLGNANNTGTIAAARLDTATTQSAGNNSTKIATTAYTDTAISNLVDSSPDALNTLNELAAALGDDANFSTTVTNSIATKLPLAGGTLTGLLNANGGIACDTDKFTVADTTGNTAIAGTLNVTGTSTFTGDITVSDSGTPGIVILDTDFSNREGTIRQDGGTMIFTAKSDQWLGDFDFFTRRQPIGGSNIDTSRFYIDPYGHIGVGINNSLHMPDTQWNDDWGPTVAIVDRRSGSLSDNPTANQHKNLYACLGMDHTNGYISFGANMWKDNSTGNNNGGHNNNAGWSKADMENPGAAVVFRGVRTGNLADQNERGEIEFWLGSQSSGSNWTRSKYVTIDSTGLELNEGSFTGDGSGLTNISGGDKILEGNTKAEVVDTGTDGHFKVEVEGDERFRITKDGYLAAGPSINVNDSYAFSLKCADDTGALYAHGRNHYLSNSSDAYSSLTLKKADADSDETDYLQLRDSANALTLKISGAGHVLTAGNYQLYGSNTPDGSDTKAIMINGGGSTSDTRGGYLLVHGNEHTVYPGVTRIHAGNVAENVNGGTIDFYTTGSERISILKDGNLSVKNKVVVDDSIGTRYVITGDFNTANTYSSGGVTIGMSVGQPQHNIRGSYIPKDGELIKFTFKQRHVSGTYYDTRTFIWEYDANNQFPGSGKCTLIGTTNYNGLVSNDSSKKWRWNYTAQSGGYSTNFEADGRNYYGNGDGGVGGAPLMGSGLSVEVGETELSTFTGLSLEKMSGGDVDDIDSHKIGFKTQSGVISEISAISKGLGGPHGRGGDLVFKTKSNNVAASSTRLVLRETGEVVVYKQDVASSTDATPKLKFNIRQTNRQESCAGMINAIGTTDWGGNLEFWSKANNGTPNEALRHTCTMEGSSNHTYFFGNVNLKAPDGQPAVLDFFSDNGDDNLDKWRYIAAADNYFHIQHYGSGGWKHCIQMWHNATQDCPTIRGPVGGIKFDSDSNPPNDGYWAAYNGDGHLHRSNGQAYLTVDDHFRIRHNSQGEQKRFEFHTDQGHADAQNDWRDDQFDFAEMFEWSDGNPSGEDRIGHTVAVDGLTGKIKIAEEGDTVIGVVSGTAAFTANCAGMQWQGAYKRDEWGRYELELVKDADGNQLYNDINNKHKKVNLVENPDWDKTKEYYTRDERKEWDKIGLIGQCYIRKTAVKPSTWIKLKEIDSTKDFYLIK